MNSEQKKDLPVSPEDVSVVIPIHKSQLSEYEMYSIRNNCSILARYPIVVIKPQSLDLEFLKGEFPAIRFESFRDDCFKSIETYNRLMMSEDFYRRFIAYEYILICQTDAFVFSDELLDWCNRGYDSVGAPWVVKRSHELPPACLYYKARKVVNALRGRRDRGVTDYKVGNGGLSLRRVSSHLRVVTEFRDTVNWYLANSGNPKFNEDVFFALEPNRRGLEFSYPDWREALQFSIDKYPAYCWQLAGEKLPFGCHAWFRYGGLEFWKPIVLGK